MISVKVQYISVRVFQPEIETAKSSLRKLYIIVAVARTFKNHLSIVSPDGNLLDDYIVVKLRNTSIAR